VQVEEVVEVVVSQWKRWEFLDVVGSCGS